MLRPTSNLPLWQFLIGFFFQTVPGVVLAPMVALSLAARGVDAALIGALATLGSVSYMAALPAAPALIRRFGDRAVFRVALALGAIAVVGLTLVEAPLAWAMLYPLLGLSAGLRYTIAEAWAPAFVAPEVRGRALAMLQTAVGAAAFVGAGALLLTGVEGMAPRAVVLVAGALGLAALWPLASPAAAPAPALRSGGSLALVGGLVLGASLLGGLFESGLWVALPLYALEAGATTGFATLVVTAMGLGSLAQYPFGWLADRFAWRRVVLGTIAAIAASALLLPLAFTWHWLLLPLAVVWGGAGGGLYTLASIRNGARLRGAQLVSASVVTQLAYMVGEAGGPTVGGLAIDLAPRHGLPILVAAVALGGLTAALWSARRPRARQAVTAS